MLYGLERSQGFDPLLLMAPMTDKETPFTPTDALLTPQEVADYLKVSVRCLDAWRYRRIGPAYFHVGRHVRYRFSAVESYLRTLEN